MHLRTLSCAYKTGVILSIALPMQSANVSPSSKFHIMAASPKIRVAILDDYQGIGAANFSHLTSKVEVQSFPETLKPSIPDQKASLIERLRPFIVISTMRERTPLPADVLTSLPNLKPPSHHWASQRLYPHTNTFRKRYHRRWCDRSSWPFGWFNYPENVPQLPRLDVAAHLVTHPRNCTKYCAR
jgi:hypothetical protein